MCQRPEGIDYHSPEGGKKSVTVRECSVTAILAAVSSLLSLSLSHTQGRYTTQVPEKRWKRERWKK